MPTLKIALYPQEERLLRSRAEPIVKITPKVQRLIDDMIETMYEAAGVGLAGPQVFVSQRLFVYDIGEGPEALINPEILISEGREIGPEGCLSIPRLHGDVPRAARIVVSGVDRRGKRVKIEAEDFLARVFQHEIDHLNGVLFPDRADQESLHYITEEEEAERKSAGGRERRREVLINRSVAETVEA